MRPDATKMRTHWKSKIVIVPLYPSNTCNSQVSFGKKSTWELVRAYVVFRLCTIGPLTRNADFVLSTSRKLFSATLVDFIVKKTFFGHFCGGESTEDLRPCINMLNENGINGILDYAAENAPDAVEEVPFSPLTPVAEEQSAYEHVQPAQSYEYTTEEDCDFHVSVFKTCITAVKDVTPQVSCP